MSFASKNQANLQSTNKSQSGSKTGAEQTSKTLAKTNEHKLQFREAFNLFDPDNTGKINLEELKAAIETHQASIKPNISDIESEEDRKFKAQWMAEDKKLIDQYKALDEERKAAKDDTERTAVEKQRQELKNQQEKRERERFKEMQGKEEWPSAYTVWQTEKEQETRNWKAEGNGDQGQEFIKEVLLHICNKATVSQLTFDEFWNEVQMWLGNCEDRNGVQRIVEGINHGDLSQKNAQVPVVLKDKIKKEFIDYFSLEKMNRTLGEKYDWVDLHKMIECVQIKKFKASEEAYVEEAKKAKLVDSNGNWIKLDGNATDEKQDPANTSDTNKEKHHYLGYVEVDDLMQMINQKKINK